MTKAIRSTKTRRIAAALLLVVFMAMMLATTAFATGEPAATVATEAVAGDTGGSGDTAKTIEQGVKTGMSKVYGIVTAIVVPIAVVCVAIAAFQFFMGGEKGMEKAKKIILYTLLGVAVAYLAPLIVNEVSTWFSSQGDQGVFT